MNPLILAAMILLAAGALLRLMLYSVTSLVRLVVIGCVVLASAGIRKIVRREPPAAVSVPAAPAAPAICGDSFC